MIRYLNEKMANYEVCVILPSGYDSNQEIPNDLIERQGNIHLKSTVNR
ncbi:hypothetical protein [Peribacillus frigoritolerans]|nr:hypothetical protein [Peribacillus frigoritolerans]MDM5312606.1 hypothetical protein [Peribacillus frigoritolerans]